jgi:hypothetical protein
MPLKRIYLSIIRRPAPQQEKDREREREIKAETRITDNIISVITLGHTCLSKQAEEQQAYKW